MESLNEPNRNHLFINYATEDADLAHWLTLKLTAEGYNVWCDKVKLLGGESYPSNIDDAIANRTFRFIALLSKNSVHKPFPLKERTSAIRLGIERREDFLIPLNVDGLKPTELGLEVSDLTYINFSQSWAEGLTALLKKLASINAPKLGQPNITGVSSYFTESDLKIDKPETLFWNMFPVIKIPQKLLVFKFAGTGLNSKDKETLTKKWAFYQNGNTLLSFRSPPGSVLQDIPLIKTGELLWQNNMFIGDRRTKDIEGFEKGSPVILKRRQTPLEGFDRHKKRGYSTPSIIKSLLKKELELICIQKGLLLTEKEELYFPECLLPNDKIHFKNYMDKKVTVLVFRKKDIKKDGNVVGHYFYHLSPTFKIRTDIFDGYLVSLKLRLYFRDAGGNPFTYKRVLAKRKKICKTWWNHQWFSRNLALLSFLSEGRDILTVGDGEEQLAFSSKLVTLDAPFGYEENIENQGDKSDGTN